MKTKKQKPKKRSSRVVATRKKPVSRRRPIHKRFFLHPLSIFAVLIIGVVLSGSTYKILAASYTVSAKVSAPFLTQPSVISDPPTGTIVTSVPITVSGTCPDNSYVKLYRNSQFSGVAMCTGQTFQISTDLFPGVNQLVAQDYNLTDDPGPTGTPITVTYSPPTPPPLPIEPTSPSGSSPSTTSTTTPSKTPSTTTSTSPFLLNSEFTYEAVTTGQVYNWKVSLSGGIAPYAVNVQWGDGSQSTMAFASALNFTINHTYTKAGNYVIKITATNAAGNSALLQIVAVVHSTHNLGAGAVGSTSPPFLTQTKHWLWLIWPSYLIILLMVISFWLSSTKSISKSSKNADHILADDNQLTGSGVH